MTAAPTPIDSGHARRSPRIPWLAAAALVVVAVGLTLVVEHTVFRSSSNSGGLRGSGVAATQTRALPSFRSVELAGANVVVVRVGGKQAVTVRADQNLLPFITTSVGGGRLVVGQSRSFTTKSDTRVEVAVPALDAVVLSGSGVLTVDGIRGSRFSVRVPGTGVLTAEGTVTRLDASLAGSGDVRLQDLIANDVTASVNGSGRLLVHADHSLHASIGGSGAIFYSGNPAKLTQSVTGSGAILKG